MKVLQLITRIKQKRLFYHTFSEIVFLNMQMRYFLIEYALIGRYLHHRNVKMSFVL